MYSSNSYKFGFNGQDAENDIYGEGNASFFKYRISDNRLGRFFAIDPLAPKYPHNSPYAFSENRVVDSRELEGLERYYSADGSYLGGIGDNTIVRVVEAEDVIAVSFYIEIAQKYPEIQDYATSAANTMSTNLNIEQKEFIRLANVLYNEGSTSVLEAAAIYSVLENRAKLRKSSVSTEAQPQFPYGVAGAGKDKIDNINKVDQNSKVVKNAYAGLILGMTSDIDFSNGAYFWDGTDFSEDPKYRGGGYYERYAPGYKFTDASHDLYNQGNNLKPGKTQYSSYNYKYESTTVQGKTTFSKLTEEWRDAQRVGKNKSNEMGE